MITLLYSNLNKYINKNVKIFHHHITKLKTAEFNELLKRASAYIVKSPLKRSVLAEGCGK